MSGANIHNKIENNVLKVVVKPNSKKNELVGWDFCKKAFRINIKAPAEKNKANKELIRFISKILKKKVRIMSGLKSKEKTLKISKNQ